MDVGKCVDDRPDEVLETFQDDEGPAEGERHEAAQPPAELRPEGERAGALEEAEIDLAPVVDAVKPAGERRVGAEQGVADEELAGAGEVGELEGVPRDGVAEVADPEEAAGDDQVQ